MMNQVKTQQATGAKIVVKSQLKLQTTSPNHNPQSKTIREINKNIIHIESFTLSSWHSLIFLIKILFKKKLHHSTLLEISCGKSYILFLVTHPYIVQHDFVNILAPTWDLLDYE